MVELSPATSEKVQKLFSRERQREVIELLETECADNLPFLGKLGPEGLERFRFAALKLSDGNFERLCSAVSLAQRDWRDLLVAAGFADDLNAHKQWEIK